MSILKIKNAFTLILFFFSFNTTTFATPKASENIINPYFIINAMEFYENDVLPFSLDAPTEISKLYSEISPFENSFDWIEHLPEDLTNNAKIIGGFLKIGAEVWKIVEKNKPIVQIKQNTLSLLPDSFDDWKKMENWQPPISKTFGVRYKNGFGMTVVHLQFKLLYTYGGQLDQKGQYLSNVTIVPALVDVAWGYELNVSVNTKNVVNLGTIHYPIAGAGLEVHWNIKTPMQHIENTESFFVQGDGISKKL